MSLLRMDHDSVMYTEKNLWAVYLMPTWLFVYVRHVIQVTWLFTCVRRVLFMCDTTLLSTWPDSMPSHWPGWNCCSTSIWRGGVSTRQQTFVGAPWQFWPLGPSSCSNWQRSCVKVSTLAFSRVCQKRGKIVVLSFASQSFFPAHHVSTNSFVEHS